jgi:hypothetical protein
MNKSYTITLKEFKQYPYISSSAWSTFKISLATFLGIYLLVNIGHHWSNPYPTARQRGGPPQAVSYKPLVLPNYEFNPDKVKTYDDIEEFVKAEGDEYHMRANLFRTRGTF